MTLQGYAKYTKNLMRPYKYAALLVNMQAILAEDEFNETYGKRRMYEKLQLDYACQYSYNTVAKVMREHGLLHERNHPKGLTVADKDAQKLNNLLKRNFTAEAPGQKVVTDITEWTAMDGKVYQSSVFDCYDNMCLGISLADNMRSELCIETLKMTCAQLKQLIFRYYKAYWNNRRICSAIGAMPPVIKRGAYYEMLADSPPDSGSS